MPPKSSTAFVLIPLTKGLYAIIDAEDSPRVCQHKWHAVGGKYAARTVRVSRGKSRMEYLHRFVLDVPSDIDIDHENGHPLDCRKSNLRPATDSQNLANRGPQANNSSGYKGVWYRKRYGNWQAAVHFQGRQIYCGVHASAEQAARAYDAKAIELFGPFAWINFREDHAA